MRRKIFDYPDKRLDKKGAWIRVRDEGDKVTMSFKQQQDNTLEGVKEAVFGIDNFEAATDFLELAGFVAKSSQETKRESWKLGAVEIEIDTWPWIPTFIEIEAPSKAELKDVVSKLGLVWDTALFGSVEVVYKHYYDVTAEQINNLQIINFSEKPNIFISDPA